MIYGIASHPVQDFETWKPIFDSDMDRAHANGITFIKLLRSVENPNDVNIFFSVPSKEAFDAFANNPILAEKMQAAGVLAPPVFRFFTEA